MMHCVFHYVSVFLILSTIVLLLLGLGIRWGAASSLLVQLIAIHYTAFATVQIGIALTAKIEKAIFKLFQWMFFIIIAVLAWLGTP